jgi:hypothetical protein
LEPFRRAIRRRIRRSFLKLANRRMNPRLIGPNRFWKPGRGQNGLLTRYAAVLDALRMIDRWAGLHAGAPRRQARFSAQKIWLNFSSTIRSTKRAALHDLIGFRRSPRASKSLKLSRQRSRVRAPSSPPYIPKELWDVWRSPHRCRKVQPLPREREDFPLSAYMEVLVVGAGRSPGSTDRRSFTTAS